MSLKVMQTLQPSWHRAWTALGVPPEATLFQQLMACYNEPHRRYHTLQHLQECVEQFESVRAITENPGAVEVALWFHDAVYERQRRDNEWQSARWARQAVRAAGASTVVAEQIVTLILATRHTALPESDDARLLVDIDLAILGASPERFEEYERQVREEYGWVPHQHFCQQRKAVLQAFLERPAIFSTAFFQDQFEVQARENLQRSIARLRADCP